MMKKKIVVTGASRGIGYETTRWLAQEGHQVLATARSESNLKELREQNPEKIHYVAADLTLPADLNTLTTAAADLFNSVDILINNAGLLINKPFEELTGEDWIRLLEVNLLSAVDLIRSLVFSPGAHIVNISSMGGFQGSSKFPGLTGYSVSKGALSILSECLAVEFADQNIRANTLCLGMVQTEMLQEAFPGIQAPLTAEEMGRFVGDFALNGAIWFNGMILPVALSDPK